MSSRDPALWGECEWGFFRWGVYTDRWEKSLASHMRTLQRAILNTAVVPNATTGRRVPIFTATDYYNFQGFLTEKMIPTILLQAGVVPRLDATLVCFDGMFIGDHIWDETTSKEYVVAEMPVEHSDDHVGGFAFRECHLNHLTFFKHPTV